MTYCRWSDDSFRCDLYCYQDTSGGWTTHVALYRDPEGLLTDPVYKVLIDLPYAGERFNDGTRVAFKERLLMLREVGYRFPDWVLATIDEEIAEMAPMGSRTDK